MNVFLAFAEVSLNLQFLLLINSNNIIAVRCKVFGKWTRHVVYVRCSGNA
jgi:hypothetical protein